MTNLEQVGEEMVGQARCPFESVQSNVGLFAGESSDDLCCLHLLTTVGPFLNNRLFIYFFQVAIFTRPP